MKALTEKYERIEKDSTCDQFLKVFFAIQGSSVYLQYLPANIALFHFLFSEHSGLLISLPYILYFVSEGFCLTFSRFFIC